MVVECGVSGSTVRVETTDTESGFSHDRLFVAIIYSQLKKSINYISQFLWIAVSNKCAVFYFAKNPVILSVIYFNCLYFFVFPESSRYIYFYPPARIIDSFNFYSISVFPTTIAVGDEPIF